MHLESSIWHHERHCLWNDKGVVKASIGYRLSQEIKKAAVMTPSFSTVYGGNPVVAGHATSHLSAISPSCWDQPNARNSSRHRLFQMSLSISLSSAVKDILSDLLVRFCIRPWLSKCCPEPDWNKYDQDTTTEPIRWSSNCLTIP